jgi:uncharacterized protein (TIGR00369 family)
MSAASGLEVLRAAAVTGEGAPPCATTLGAELVSVEPGHVRVRFDAREEFCNGMGNVQGGFLAAMLDDSMGPALFTLLDEGQFAPTLEMKVSFLRAAKPGAIVGEGRVAHKTRNVAFLDGTLSTEDGMVIATATATARILAPPSNGAAQ